MNIGVDQTDERFSYMMGWDIERFNRMHEDEPEGSGDL